MYKIFMLQKRCLAVLSAGVLCLSAVNAVHAEPVYGPSEVEANPGAATPTPAPTEKPPEPPKTSDTDTSEGDGKILPSKIYMGAGVVLSAGFRKDRVSGLEFIQKPNGDVYVQIKNLQNVNVGFVAETHYGIPAGKDGKNLRVDLLHKPQDIGNVLMCGPWILFKYASGMSCGPQFLANIASDNSKLVSQFGIGWAMSLPGQTAPAAAGKTGDESQKPDFTMGMGFLIEPSTPVLDGRVIDKETRLVRSEFKTGVLNKSIDPIVNRSSASFYVMISKVF
jgi:hypothetical protein